MANPENHEYKQLASELSAAADGIVNSAAVGLEHNLRTASAILNEMDQPVPLVSKLNSEISKIANACPDAATARKLRRLIGEA
jgi:hypothetical protein